MPATINSKHFLNLLAISLLTTGLAHASTLLGSQVTLTVDSPTIGNAISVPVTETVGPGTTFPSGSIVGIDVIGVNIDVGATTIDIDYDEAATASTGTFNGYVFDFSGAPVITSVSLDPSSKFNSSQVGLGFGPDQVTVNVEGLSFTPSTSILLDLTLAPSTGTPEPSTWLLFVIGIGLIGLHPKGNSLSRALRILPRPTTRTSR